MKVIKITVGNKVCSLSVKMFDDEIDIETLLKIDYSNLIAEMITFPVVVNRFGLLLADVESAVSESKLNLEIYEAKKREILRKNLTEESEDSKGNTKYTKPTVDELNNAITKDITFQTLKRNVIKKQKERDYINSIFWAAKDKSNKLDKLSLSVQPGDIDEKFIAKAINGIEIKFNNSLIK